MKTKLLLADHMKRLKLPTIAGIYDKLAREAQDKGFQRPRIHPRAQKDVYSLNSFFSRGRSLLG